MTEFRFFSYTDFAFRPNFTDDSIRLPFHTYRPAAERLIGNETENSEPTHELNVPYTVFEILVAVFAVVGNLMVIIVFKRERKLRRRTNYYIVSLAFADLLVGSLGVPFAILASIGLPTNLYACLFTVSLLIVLCTTSIFCLVAVSVDRYWAILYPMAYSRNVRTKTAIVIISLCWVAGSVVGFLPLLGWHADVEMHQACLFTVVMDYNYLVFLYFATIITPALLMLAFYVHIYRVIVRQVRQIVTMNPVGDCSRRSSTAQIQTTSMTARPCHGGTMLRVLGASRKREVKATQNLSIIVLFFMICWFPLYTINCIQAFCKTCRIPDKLTLFCIILSHLNSAVNPVLYAYHLRDFRAALKNLILRIMGVEVEPSMDAVHRYSLASQHRLQSIDANMRNTANRIYIDSPIWLRQQQQQAMKNSPLNKYGVISPCLNNLNQTVAAVAAVTPDIENNKMWNIREVSSGQEIGTAEISYIFPEALDVDIRPHQCQGNSEDRSDSPYMYENRNYSPDDDDDDGDIKHPNDDVENDVDNDDVVGNDQKKVDDVHVDTDHDDVFLPNGVAKKKSKNDETTPNATLHSTYSIHKELDQLTCNIREKLRSDDLDYMTMLRSNQSNVISDSSLSEYGTARESIPQAPARNKTHQHQHQQKTSVTISSTSSSSPSMSVSPNRVAQRRQPFDNARGTSVYVIDHDYHTLAHRSRRKAATTMRNGRSRSCSCNTPDSPSSPRTMAAEFANSIGSLSTTNPSRLANSENINNNNNNNNHNNNNRSNHNNNSHTANNLNFYAEMQQQQQQQQQQVQQHQRHHSTQHHRNSEKFSPLKAVSNFIFPPIVKHSSLFQLFHPHITGSVNEDATTTTTTSTTATTSTNISASEGTTIAVTTTNATNSNSSSSIVSATNAPVPSSMKQQTTPSSTPTDNNSSNTTMGGKVSSSLS